jgi:hypothetical protein
MAFIEIFKSNTAMILTDAEVEARLNSEGNLVNQVNTNKNTTIVIPVPNGGRTVGATQIPPKVRQLVGVLSNMGETQQAIAGVFGITQPSVGTASRGLIGNRIATEEEGLVEQNEKFSTKENLNSAHNLALDAMVASITVLKTKLPEVTKPKDLARIATDMSRIVSNLTPKDKGGLVNNTQVVLFNVPGKKESDYECIEA